MELNLDMKIAALAGGVGGAKLAHGFAQALPPGDLTVIVNTGDDFVHFGLAICPDLDTVCYTLAGLVDPVNGWGRADETYRALESLKVLGGPGWFRLGDLDLGTHLERTRLLQAGEPLSAITGRFCRHWGIGPRVLPVSDDPIPTRVYTDEGVLAFQEYFVQRRCEVKVKGFRFENVEKSSPAPGVLEALQEAELIVFCPSNPWVSIDPILAVPGIRQAILGRRVLAVSPIIAGQTVKGPAAKMYADFGIQPSALAVARHYSSRKSGGLLSGFILDSKDIEQEKEIAALGIRTLVTDILIPTAVERRRLAEEILSFGKDLV